MYTFKLATIGMIPKPTIDSLPFDIYMAHVNSCPLAMNYPLHINIHFFPYL